MIRNRSETAMLKGKPMTTANYLREGIAAEQHRLEMLDEAARLRLIASAHPSDGIDRRPFGAPGSFLHYLQKHFASGRFRPATIHPTTVTNR